MDSTKLVVPELKLSICITTLNRGEFIAATLDSIVSQLTADCELVVLDGGSTDNTGRVLCDYVRKFEKLRYIRQDTNNGIDRDFDRVVELARGEYCWLMSDDDFLKPGAVRAVLEALRRDVSLVIVNVEVRNFDMSKVMQCRRLEFDSNREYGTGEMDRLFVEAGHYLTYCGCAVIRRSIWMERDRPRYYDSLFVHVGVIFQEPLPTEALVIAEPLISYRMSNAHTFSPQVVDIVWMKWPSVVRSLALSEEAKNKICGVESWARFRELLLWRAFGLYSIREYRLYLRSQLVTPRNRIIPVLVAVMPGRLANALCVLYYTATRRPHRGRRGLWSSDVVLQALRDSRFSLRSWQAFRRAP